MSKLKSEIISELDELMAQLIELDINEANSYIGTLMKDLTPAEIIDYRDAGGVDEFLNGLNPNEICQYVYDELELDEKDVENLLCAIDSNSTGVHDELIEICHKNFEQIVFQVDTDRALSMLETLENSYHASYRVA